MNKKQLFLYITIGILLGLLLYYPISSQNQFQVTFQYEDGRVHEIIEVKKGSPIPMPADPSQNNYIFIGWFTHPVQGKKYDLSQGITQNLTLYARFQLDAVTITNDITKNIMKSLVKIECRSYNWESGFSETGWAQGSGFCYSAGNDYYYILTNCHAVCKNAEDNRLEIKIYDYRGNKYNGYLYNNPNKHGDAISPDYDLACIYFISESSDVKPLPIVKNNPTEEADVIALGAPRSQMNSITFGKVINYPTITLHNTPAYESNVKFPVIHHSAETDGGSSGGPILNSDLNVVGVHFAGSTAQSGYAIPAEKVQEFLQKYVR